MIKKLNVLSLLLLVNFNNNIISMKVNNLASESENLEQNSAFLNLPEEIIQIIIAQLIDTNKIDNFLKKVKDTKNIFQLYSLKAPTYKNILINFKKELIANLKSIRLTSLQLNYSAKYCINKLIKYYTNKLKNSFKEKKQEFITEIKEQYANYDQDKLNSRLKNILDLGFMVNRSNLEEAAKLIIAGADTNMQYDNYWAYHAILALGINKSHYGETTLMLAEANGYQDIVELIISKTKIDKPNTFCLIS